MNEKPRVRFNIIDFLIVIAVIAAILTVVFRGTLTELIGNVIYTQDAVLTLRADGLTEEQIGQISEGDVLYLGDEKLGNIISKSYENSRGLILDSSGAGSVFLSVRDPEHFDITISVNVKGVYSDDGFHLFGKNFVGVGEKLGVISEKYGYEVTIISIT